MRVRSHFLAAAVTVLCGIVQPFPSSADVLAELFTSQGCSSCPPADKVLAKIAEDEGVIALSFHVDYWDYLGWRDTFASPEHTARQAAYRDAWDASVVYTPQIVIDGRVSVPAANARKVARAIEKARDAKARQALRIESGGGMVKARLDPAGMSRPCTVWVAKYRREETVAVDRGENAGKTLTYRNVVTSLDRIGDWEGREGETVMLPRPEPGEGVAIWLQDGPGGPVLAAENHEN